MKRARSPEAKHLQLAHLLRTMCRNINFHADNLLDTPAVFELMAFLDKAKFSVGSKTIQGMSVEEVDEKLYDLQDKLFARYDPIIQKLSEKIDLKADKADVDILTQAVGDLTTAVDGKADKSEVENLAKTKADKSEVENLTQAINGKVDAAAYNQLLQRVEKIEANEKEQPLGDSTNKPKGILRKSSSYKQVEFDKARVRRIPSRVSKSEQYSNMSHAIKLMLSGDNNCICLGLMPVCGGTSRIGLLRQGSTTFIEVLGNGPKVPTFADTAFACTTGYLTPSSFLFPKFVVSDWIVRNNEFSAGVVLDLQGLRMNLRMILPDGSIPSHLFRRNKCQVTYVQLPGKGDEFSEPMQRHRYTWFVKIGDTLGNIGLGLGHGSLVQLFPNGLGLGHGSPAQFKNSVSLVLQQLTKQTIIRELVVQVC